MATSMEQIDWSAAYPDYTERMQAIADAVHFLHMSSDIVFKDWQLI